MCARIVLASGRATGRVTRCPLVLSLFPSSFPRLDESTGRIDYDALERNAQLFRPKIIIAGALRYMRSIT